MQKIKVSDLPEASTLSGYYGLGVDKDGKSAKVGFTQVQEAADAATKAAANVQTATDAANAAATSANSAATKATSAASSATSAASSATSAASSANSAATKATSAATAATEAAETASSAATKANTAASSANTAASSVNTAISNAEAATTKANEAASSANTAASAANEAATSANSAAKTATTAAEDVQSAVKSATDAADAATKAATDVEAATTAANTAATAANTAANSVNEAITNAEAATKSATEAATSANTAASSANDAAAAAKTATTNAETATTNAETATKAANEAATAANTAATDVEAATKAANEAATAANTAANSVNTAITNAETATKAANDAADSVGTAITNAETATKAATEASEAAKTATDAANSAASAADKAADAANDAATDVEAATKSANEAATAANTAASSVNTAISNAEAATKSANEAAESVNTAITNAETATKAANDAATAANTATTAANTATTNAETAAKSATDAADAANKAATDVEEATKAANDAADAANEAAKNITSGKDGQTPYIGDNGDWWIGEGDDAKDLGVAAQGEKGDPGDTPEITISDDTGNWVIDGVDTGVHAQGEKGDKGDKGDAGTDGDTFNLDRTDEGVKITVNHADGTTGSETVYDGKDGTDGNTPYIGDNGNWWIGNVDTGVHAQGEKGDKGDAADTTPTEADSGYIVTRPLEIADTDAVTKDLLDNTEDGPYFWTDAQSFEITGDGFTADGAVLTFPENTGILSGVAKIVCAYSDGSTRTGFLPWKKTAEVCKLTISATPSGAFAIINGTKVEAGEDGLITTLIDFGSEVNWSVEAPGYKTESGTIAALRNNATFSSALEYAGVKDLDSLADGCYLCTLEDDGNVYYPIEGCDAGVPGTAFGVLVVSGSTRMVVALDSGGSHKWSAVTDTATGGVTIGSSTTANTDYDGKSNTALACQQMTNNGNTLSTTYAVSNCMIYSAGPIAAGAWWLPAAGEIVDYIVPNLSEINDLISAGGGDAIATTSYLWSSTQSSASDAWRVSTASGSLSNYAKSYSSFVRAVSAL